tara:strand:+ start:2489 stop:4675 length:2187 start_codon:yes stop_codon:yes gene_type:complete
MLITNIEALPPDGLRGELGKYYTKITNPITNESSPLIARPFSSGRIKKSLIGQGQTSTTSVIPKQTFKIFISSDESEFRDQRQWANFLSEKIIPGANFLDHTFSMPNFEVETSIVKNYHLPQYEDFTKTYGSNQLLNINLISHQSKNDITTRISSLRSNFDPEGFEITGRESLNKVMREFDNRLLNYTDSVSEISRKQRNVFNLGSLLLDSSTTEQYPFYLEKEIISNLGFSNEFSENLDDTFILKHLFQSVKNGVSSEFRDFSTPESNIQIRTSNIINLMLSSTISEFNENFDETFLMSEYELNTVGPRGRFINNVRATIFLSNLRSFLVDKSRTIDDIYNCHVSDKFLIGYKIEKYLDNTAGDPIQTYYVKSTNLNDTQLKYGRKYIYKTKALMAVLGSSYTYSNLTVSQNEIDMIGSDGLVVEEHPVEYSNISSDKFRAYLNVEVRPSFQLVEYEIEEASHCLIDSPVLYPHVDFYNSKDEPTTTFMFSPNMFTISSGSLAGPTREESLVRSLEPLLESDIQIKNLLNLGEHRIDHRYFYGQYEIYRTTNPPKERGDFADNFLTSVDTESFVFFNNRSVPQASYDILHRDYRSEFTDTLIPNKKYYYAFRALTYHGTPSNLTIPYEVELLKDSDEYRLEIKEYKYPEIKNYEKTNEFRRLVRIAPNPDRLFPFLDPQTQFIDEIGYDSDKLISMGSGKTFKIRIKSKHTGKIIDLNISFKGVDRT